MGERPRSRRVETSRRRQKDGSQQDPRQYTKIPDPRSEKSIKFVREIRPPGGVARSELWHQSPSLYGNFFTRRPRGGRSGPPVSVYPPLVSSFCPISGRLAPDLATMLGPKQGGKHQASVSESPQIVRIEPQGFWCIVGGPPLLRGQVGGIAEV